jgi:hypothetical protein
MPRFFREWPLRHLMLAFSSFLVVLTIGSYASGASPAAKTVAKVEIPQPLFEAIAAGDLEAGVVPRDAKQLTIQLKNKTDRPLTIQMPPALAAAPVLAQQPGALFPGFPPNNNNNNNQGNQAPQQLGLPGGQGNNGGGWGQGNRPGGIFNIPAGRAIKIKSSCVCLEYGKPEPDVRMKYELKPLAEVNDSAALAQVLRSLGDELIDQRVAQAATWHVTNELSWDKLAGLVSRQVGGVKEMQFNAAEVATAKAFLDKLAAKDLKARSPAETASR